jgi:nucleoside-diphosphate-sugar epimerase
MSFWKGKTALVTGGCSFIGSHLVDALVARGATVRIADDLSSGTTANVQHHLAAKSVEFLQEDLLAPGAAERAVQGMEHVFHLAANHGGRGYIDLHQAACATNLALDGLMIRAAHKGGVQKFTFASSGCVYPEHLQHDPSQILFLTEDLVKPPYNADNLYGWAKLMCELTLRAYYQDYGFKCASLRYFTAYGERCLENHAVIAMIARAFVKQDPFIVWGTGEQIRNWTYVSDIVEGTILAAEKIDDGTAVNLGTMERTRVIDAAQMILDRTGVKSKLLPDPTKPTGPYNRVCDNSLTQKLLGWSPKVSFSDGLDRTIKWYFETKERERIGADLERLLTER